MVSDVARVEGQALRAPIAERQRTHGLGDRGVTAGKPDAEVAEEVVPLEFGLPREITCEHDLVFAHIEGGQAHAFDRLVHPPAARPRRYAAAVDHKAPRPAFFDRKLGAAYGFLDADAVAQLNATKHGRRFGVRPRLCHVSLALRQAAQDPDPVVKAEDLLARLPIAAIPAPFRLIEEEHVGFAQGHPHRIPQFADVAPASRHPLPGLGNSGP